MTRNPNQIANVDYFWKRCNQVLNTQYAYHSKRAINVYWLVQAAKKVFRDIHNPANSCRRSFSTSFNISESGHKQGATVSLVDKVVAYLAHYNAECDPDCACSSHIGQCACSTSGTCECECNCNCSYDCGTSAECDCVCAEYVCDCVPLPNCDYFCECDCNCYNDCPCSEGAG